MNVMKWRHAMLCEWTVMYCVRVVWTKCDSCWIVTVDNIVNILLVTAVSVFAIVICVIVVTALIR